MLMYKMWLKYRFDESDWHRERRALGRAVLTAQGLLGGGHCRDTQVPRGGAWRGHAARGAEGGDRTGTAYQGHVRISRLDGR